MSAVLLAASDGGPVWLLLAGPAAGGGFYYGWWRFYRNTDKSHRFERETRVQAKQATGTDMKVDEVRGTKRSSIDGANHTDHRERVQRMQ